MRDAVGCAEADEHLAAAVPDERAKPRQTHAASLDDALQLPVAQRNVGGQYDDAAAPVGLVFVQRAPDVLANGAMIDREIAQPAVIGLNEHAQRVDAPVQLDPPRRGAHTALEAVAGHAAPAAHSALLKFGAGGVYGRKDVLLPNRAVADVVERRVVALAHDGIDRAHLHAVLFAQARHVFDHRVVNQADV